MYIMRAVVKGLIGGAVATRSIFTADVGYNEADTPALLWDVYLTQFWEAVIPFISNVWAATDYELYIPAAGHWELVDQTEFTKTGALSGEQLANAVALVLIGKAAGLRHVGRKFLSPLAETSGAGNIFAASYVADAAQALLYYISPVVGLGGGYLRPGVVTASGDFHEFVGGVVSSLLGSIRRRKPGRGI